MNVVVHAYPEGEAGLLEVEAVPDGDGLTVAVRDFGRGISPRPGVDRPSLRIGLALIAALSSQLRDPRRGRAGNRNPHAPAAALAGRSPTIESRLARGPAGPRGDRDCRSARPELRRPGAEPGADRARRPPRDHRRPDLRRDAALRRDLGGGAAAPSPTASVRLSIADRPEGVELRVGPMASGRRRGPARRASRCPTSAARWKRSPTRCAPKPTATASTSSSASPR